MRLISIVLVFSARVAMTTSARPSVLSRFRPYVPLLAVAALIGGVGLNGTFLYHAFLYPDTMGAALQNPIGAVFIAEALVMTALLAVGVAVLPTRRVGWKGFVGLSIVGGIAFSVPVALWLELRHAESHAPGESHPE